MGHLTEDVSRLEQLLKDFERARGRATVLTGAGISAESGIPTFRGPEGYWTVGSREYRPEEMATAHMFERDPWEVWSWYLYRRSICRNTEPNRGHREVVRLEQMLEDRFRLVTQNVDGLHLRAGNTRERTYQIHGNLNFMRCARTCTRQIYAIPDTLGDKDRNQPVPANEKQALRCPACGSLARPHVLWFDECYDEHFYQAETATRWAYASDLLLVIGTAGATSLPMQIGRMMSGNPETIVLDVNPQTNPFARMAATHPRGAFLQGTSGDVLPHLRTVWEEAMQQGSGP